jgi:predicted ArsR family transcriptional regulator
MSLKKRLARRYMPSSTKWELALKGVGKLYKAIYDELRKNGDGSQEKAMAHAAYKTGLDFGEDLKKEFRLRGTIEDIAFAMDVEHKIFGMRAKIAEKNDSKITYHCYQCAWQKYFTPKLCIAIGQAEKGIAQALSPKAKYNILQTRTMGKDKCIFTIEI